MIGKLKSIVLDCPDPEALAVFYRGVLGGRIEIDEQETGPAGDGWIDLYFAESGPRISFQRSPGYVAPRWPSDDGDQQIHLDVRVDDFDIAEAALLELGARFVGSYDGFRVYLDPVGHPFCTVG